MARDNKTKVHAIPTNVYLLPANDNNCWNMFRSRTYCNNDVYCVFLNDEGKYETAYFDIFQMKEKKPFKLYVSKEGGRGYLRVETVSRDRVFFAYFSNEYENFLDVKALNNCIEVVGTKKKTYFDLVQSCGRDFSYEKPYVEFYHQPAIKNRSLDLRRKFSDVLTLTMTIDELDDELFSAIQRLAIDKFRVIERTGIHNDETHPCVVVEKIPVKLSNAKLRFSNKIHFRIEKAGSWTRKTPYLKMKAGDSFDSYLGNMYMKTAYEDVDTLERADEILTEFMKYVRIVPKLNSPWLFH